MTQPKKEEYEEDRKIEVDEEQTIEVRHPSVENTDKPEKRGDDSKEAPIGLKVKPREDIKEKKGDPRLKEVLYDNFPYTDSVEALKGLNPGEFKEEDIRIALVTARGDLNLAAGYLFSVMS